MKFCMVTTFYPPFNFGGDGLFVQQLATDLVAAGHEVHVVHCLDAYRVMGGQVPREIPLEEKVAGVHLHRLRSGLGRMSALLTQQTGRPVLKDAALRRILGQDFDVINFHNISLVGGPGILRLGRGLRIYTLHEHWWVCPTHVLWKYTGELCTSRSCLRCTLAQRTPPQAWRLSPGWMGKCLSHVDLILAPSEFTAGRHREWLADHDIQVPLEVLPEYVPVPEKAVSTPSGLPPRYFLYVGRLARAKGILDLAATFARRPRLSLVVVGRGEAEDELRRLALPNVHLRGWVPRQELGGYYAAATGLVFPSRCAETFGLAAAESLSYGTPVIARRAGGVADVVDDTVGFMYDTAAELEAALDQLWTGPDMRRQMSDSALERYRRNYAPEVYLRNYLGAITRARR